MSAVAETILQHLRAVEHQRMRRRADPGLAARVQAVKQYQQARFERTYADLLGDARYGGAARFFLDELYGPHDFAQRDAQFVRIVPAMVRLFPREIVHTVAQLAALHDLSEHLDSEMAHHLPGPDVAADSYQRAWQATGRAADRERQIELMLAVGRALDVYTRNPLLRHTLRMMRVPARSAGLAALQAFLESGFDTFRAMRGAEPFLETVAQRERALAARLFDRDGAAPAAGDDPLGQLP